MYPYRSSVDVTEFDNLSVDQGRKCFCTVFIRMDVVGGYYFLRSIECLFVTTPSVLIVCISIDFSETVTSILCILGLQMIGNSAFEMVPSGSAILHL